MGANKVIPFSSFQRYQREDSVWANDLIPELADYYADALPNWPEIFPAFVRVDCETDEITPLNPRRAPRVIKKPEDFGDSWSDPLTASDKAQDPPLLHGSRGVARPFWIYRGVGRQVDCHGRPKSREAQYRHQVRVSAQLVDDLYRTTSCSTIC